MIESVLFFTGTKKNAYAYVNWCLNAAVSVVCAENKTKMAIVPLAPFVHTSHLIPPNSTIGPFVLDQQILDYVNAELLLILCSYSALKVCQEFSDSKQIIEH